MSIPAQFPPRGGKTITRPPRELAEYQPLFDNARKLRALLADLQDLTMQIIDEGNGQEPRPREPERNPPESVV